MLVLNVWVKFESLIIIYLKVNIIILILIVFSVLLYNFFIDSMLC